jgi:hypothetical protein
MKSVLLLKMGVGGGCGRWRYVALPRAVSGSLLWLSPTSRSSPHPTPRVHSPPAHPLSPAALYHRDNRRPSTAAMAVASLGSSPPACAHQPIDRPPAHLQPTRPPIPPIPYSRSRGGLRRCFPSHPASPFKVNTLLLIRSWRPTQVSKSKLWSWRDE